MAIYRGRILARGAQLQTSQKTTLMVRSIRVVFCDVYFSS